MNRSPVLLLALCACVGPTSELVCEGDDTLPLVRIGNVSSDTPVAANLTVFGGAWREDGSAVTSVTVLDVAATRTLDDYTAWEIALPIERLRSAVGEDGHVWIHAVAEDICGRRNVPACDLGPAADTDTETDTGSDPSFTTGRDCIRIAVAPAT